jgi:glucosamine--fructose-6-phosphate aminotransferase (isomerizing)
MCGIFACLSSCKTGLTVSDMVLKGLEMILNRGYDSMGMASVVVPTNKLMVCKNVNQLETTGSGSGLEKLKKQWDEKPNPLFFHGAIAHSRWSTHGENTQANAHPHLDTSEIVAVVHNGIIENTHFIKKQHPDIVWNSETDTEVIPQLIAKTRKESSIDKTWLEIIQQSLTSLHGTWALVLLFANEPNRIYFAKNGSPLLLGFRDTEAFICSESTVLSAFQCQRFVNLRDGQIGYIEMNQELKRIHLHIIQGGSVIHPSESQFSLKKQESKTKIKDHWMLQEIMEQKQVCLHLFQKRDQLIPLQISLRKAEFDSIVFLGCGTSFHAALFGCRLFKECLYKLSHRRMTIEAYDASTDDDSHFSNKGLEEKQLHLYVLLSQSGETKDIHRCLQSIRHHKNNVVLTLTNVVDSLLARESDFVVPISAGKEVSVASTKSFTAQIACIVQLGNVLFPACNLWTTQIPLQMTNDIESKQIDLCSKLANKINYSLNSFTTNSMFVLGRGWTESLAKEAALKIKEVSYIHAEALSSASLKHGPLSLIIKGVPVLFLAHKDDQYIKILNAASEVRSRQGYTILITNQPTLSCGEPELFTDIIQIPMNGGEQEHQNWMCIQLIYSIQLLAYYLAIVRKLNPDYPRNLAKTVTTD